MKLIGRVESMIGDKSFVTLFRPETGEILESQCDSKILTDRNIKAGDEFQVEVKGKNITVEKLDPKPISADQMRAIYEEVDNRLSGHHDGETPV